MNVKKRKNIEKRKKETMNVKKRKEERMNVIIYLGLCSDVAQGLRSEAPNEKRTQSRRFASLAC